MFYALNCYIQIHFRFSCILCLLIRELLDGADMWCSCCGWTAECYSCHSHFSLKQCMAWFQVIICLIKSYKIPCFRYWQGQNVIFRPNFLRFAAWFANVFALFFFFLLLCVGYSKFGDIFDEDFFIYALSKNVKVVKELPKDVLERYNYNISSIVNLRLKAWSSPAYYLHKVLPQLLRLGYAIHWLLFFYFLFFVSVVLLGIVASLYAWFFLLFLYNFPECLITSYVIEYEIAHMQKRNGMIA